MSSEEEFEPPTITDEDIYRASRLLGLRADAFYGEDGTDKRQEVLKRMDSIDIAACPGSGKTTLLVAKLAILVEKWQYRTRGICIISHTNAARYEIEKHLGNTAAGRRLLGYPHYIGTIHGFVNEFLALPHLRSLGYPIKMIDTEVCHRKRWYSLPKNTRSALECQYGPSVLSVKTPEFGVGEIRWGKGVLGVDTSTYVDIQKACRKSAIDGYFCYDEMFMWAENLIETVSGVVDVLRNRFPILLIDEAQDNSKDQSAILSRIFMEGENSVIRQRFGDANQAIFDSQKSEEAAVDKFPGLNKVELQNSYRFGQAIADIANPLGLDPSGLQGVGPRKLSASDSLAEKHTIFLFSDNSASKVMDAYGALLLETFSDQELGGGKFIATAVGHTHRLPEESKEHKFPHHIGHYWPYYVPELSKQDPIPKTFIQYVFAGQGRAELRNETHAMVEKIAEGFFRLVSFSEEGKSVIRTKTLQPHRHILRLLENSPEMQLKYQELLMQFTVRQEMPTFQTWSDYWCCVVRNIAETLVGSKLSEDANYFLNWNDKVITPEKTIDSNKSRNNLFSYCENGRGISIRVGSIHSVKGQTHTATLVLETFWNKHNLELLLPWLTKSEYGGRGVGIQQRDRLKLHYVAMTRPTHLLCLAMKQDVLKYEHVDVIRKSGWQVCQVQSDGRTVPWVPISGKKLIDNPQMDMF